VFFPKKSLVSGGIWYLAVEETTWPGKLQEAVGSMSPRQPLPQNLGTFHPGVKETWNLTFPTEALYSGWWLTYPEKYESVGIIIPNIWNKLEKCSKPPTSTSCIHHNGL